MESLDRVSPFGSVLDLGCGDARVGRYLREAKLSPEPIVYVGVDNCPDLLSVAPPEPGGSLKAPVRLHEADLGVAGWSQCLGNNAGFDVVVSFSALHHIPGQDLRLQLLEEIRSLLNPGGVFICSVWQVFGSPRLQRKIQPWSEAGLQSEDVDDFDLLMDWQRDGRGLRYVHHFSEEELCGLLQAASFEVVETFYSDGQSGKMGLYAISRHK